MTQPHSEVIAAYDAWGPTYDSSPNPLIPIEEMAVLSELIPGRTFPYPSYHSRVEDYTEPVLAAGATLLAALDIPSRWIPPEGERVAVPGALIVWARA